MSIRFDWKFLLTLLVALAGVLVPVWLWRADISARSLHIKKISQTSLQPPDSAKALSLTISIAGAELHTPYLTVFELVNDGAKPVPSSDFESSIEISTANAAKIVRTTLTNTTPKDLLPDVVLESGIVRIKPILLNPGDSATFAVLTSGDAPSFVSRARIAGVPSVPIDEETSKTKSPRITATFSIFALAFFAISYLTYDGWTAKGCHLRPRAAFFVSFITFTSGAAMSMGFAESLGYSGAWPAIILGGVALLIAGYFGIWLNASKETSVGNSESDAE